MRTKFYWEQGVCRASDQIELVCVRIPDDPDGRFLCLVDVLGDNCSPPIRTYTAVANSLNAGRKLCERGYYVLAKGKPHLATVSKRRVKA
ncbi:MAG: hypothetical protein O9256_00185 [Rhizobiaceae bacterium]|nr:hypothetical protein [Rhizobiaceae bacterium]